MTRTDSKRPSPSGRSEAAHLVQELKLGKARYRALTVTLLGAGALCILGGLALQAAPRLRGAGGLLLVLGGALGAMAKQGVPLLQLRFEAKCSTAIHEERRARKKLQERERLRQFRRRRRRR